MYGQFKEDSSNLVLQSLVSDKDLIFRGNDDGSEITAFTLDMSDGGAATLNNGLTLSDGDLTVASGHGINFAATADSTATGATATSELLDDYEEGDWTPTSTALGVATIHTAKYTKIGSFCAVYCDVTRNASPADTSQGSGLTGMPFSAGDDYPCLLYTSPSPRD